MLELLLSQKLKDEYREAGFSLGEDEGKLYLYHRAVVKEWPSTKVTFEQVEEYIKSLIGEAK